MGSKTYQEYTIRTFGSYYPCIKYQIPANKTIDGTESFVVAESMLFDISQYLRNDFDTRSAMHCNLTFTCENNTKVFYKVLKECSHNIILVKIILKL